VLDGIARSKSGVWPWLFVEDHKIGTLFAARTVERRRGRSGEGYGFDFVVAGMSRSRRDLAFLLHGRKGFSVSGPSTLPYINVVEEDQAGVVSLESHCWPMRGQSSRYL
jgi:hypothetical protein